MNRYLYWSILAVFSTGSILLTWSCRKGDFPGDQEKVRHIILVSIDTCRADYLSCYGYERQTTPNIDALAAEGVLFENVVSPVPLTLPAHSSILTGTIPAYHGVHDNSDYRLGATNLTLAEILHDRGYTTGGIVSSFTLNSIFGLDQGFDSYQDEFEQELEKETSSQCSGGEVSRRACQWLQEHREESFLLFLHYFDPHKEYNPPEPFATTFADHPYAGEIAYADHCIGQVIQKLKDLGIYDSSLIVVTGDHGEMLGEHGEMTHGYYIYQAALKVPLVIKPPRGCLPLRVTDTVGLIDVAPTILGRLAIDVPPMMQGKDLLAGFPQREISLPDRHFYCESVVPQEYKCAALFGLVTDRWKYIQAPREELYDLTSDPAEQVNLARQQVQQRRKLQNQLKLTLNRQSQAEQSENTFVLDRQARRRLQSLGYIAGEVSATLEFDPTGGDPKDFIALHVGSTYLQPLVVRKEFAKAEALGRKMLVEYPDCANIYYCLGKAVHGQGRLAEAVDLLNRCLQLDPDDFLAHYELARVLLKIGRPKTAVTHFQEMVRLNPDAIKAHLNIGEIRARQNRLDEAISHFEQALEIRPDDADVHVNLGRVLLLQGRTDEAVRHWKKALTINPDRPDILNDLAWILATSDRKDIRSPAEAVDLARRACKMSGYGQPGPLDTLAAAYAAAGDFARAAQLARQALDLTAAGGARDIQDRLELYERGQPYRELPPTPDSP